MKAENRMRIVLENLLESRYMPAPSGMNQHGNIMTMFFLNILPKSLLSFLSLYRAAMMPYPHGHARVP